MTRFACFYHSVISDWNNGNAHFVRGLARALQARGHVVTCFEPVDNWSLTHLLQISPDAVARFKAQFAGLHVERYEATDATEFWLTERLHETDVVIVHEWNDPELVQRIGTLAKRMGKVTLFHDTHYRVVLDTSYRDRLGLEAYTYILAFSPSVAERYRQLGLTNVEVLHEAADVELFYPRDVPKQNDVVFVGNYGDGDRSDELEDFVFGPRAALPDLRFAVYGVRYPDHVLARLRNGLNIDYGGWLPNPAVPTVYSMARVVLHVPRRQYVALLPGTPTIRVFEALACGACLLSLPWPDTDHLFEAGRDYAIAGTPAEMRKQIDWLTRNDDARSAFAERGRQTILDRHTCGHRADQLLELVAA